MEYVSSVIKKRTNPQLFEANKIAFNRFKNEFDTIVSSEGQKSEESVKEFKKKKGVAYISDQARYMDCRSD